jgi:hypothetical protein
MGTTIKVTSVKPYIVHTGVIGDSMIDAKYETEIKANVFLEEIKRMEISIITEERVEESEAEQYIKKLLSKV